MLLVVYYRLQDLFRCPQSHLTRGQCSTTQGAHTPSTCFNNETTDSPEGPFLKAHHNSPQNPTLPLVCAKTPTLRLLLPAPKKFCISPALACMLGYKLLIMKCELLFRSFTIQPCASLLLACILSPLPEVVGGKLVHSLSVFSQMFQAG